MYATAVGLVLAGFRSLDEREDRYKEAREMVKVNVKQMLRNPFRPKTSSTTSSQKQRVC
jgi:cell division protein FtsA